MNSLTHLPRLIVARTQSHFASERGASMVEYALLVALIAMVAVATVAIFGEKLGDTYNDIADKVADATGA